MRTSKTNETPNTPDVWSRLWRTIGHLLGVLLRLLFVVVVAVLLAAGVYLGAPWVYRHVIHPVQSSMAQLTLLQRQVDETNAQWAESFGAQQQRVASLESQLAGQGERTASLEASLSRMDEALTEQQATLNELSSAVDAISNNYASVAEVGTLRDEFATLEKDVMLSEQVTAQLETLEHRIVLVQTWQEVLKTRLYVTEGNVGDAETTLALAMTHLGQVAVLRPESEREAITTIQTYLTRAASRLREQPILAAQDLESAWYELGALITPE
jgi:septal ring factor EnvC (AmiA/AmiB activator)